MKILRPKTGGQVVLKKYGKAFFLKMNRKRWANYRKQKKLYDAQEKANLSAKK